MRVFLATAVLIGSALLCYSGVFATGVSAQGQATQAAIMEGEKLTVRFDPDRAGYSCTVIAVRGDFVGCRTEAQGVGRPPVERWYNLRLLTVIERAAKTE